MERKKLRQMQKVRKKLVFLAGAAQGDDGLVKPGLLSSTDVKDCPSQLAIHTTALSFTLRKCLKKA